MDTRLAKMADSCGASRRRRPGAVVGGGIVVLRVTISAVVEREARPCPDHRLRPILGRHLLPKPTSGVVRGDCGRNVCLLENLAGPLAAAATLGLWFLLHAVTFSLFDLGAPYPWYVTVLIPPPLILAVSGVALALQTPKRAGRFAAVVAVAAVLVPIVSWARDTAYLLRHGNPVRVAEAFESDRRLVGLFIRQFADPTEVIESGIGWVAAETPNPINDRTGLNSVVMHR